MTPKMTQKNYEAIKIYNQKEKIFELKGQIQTLKQQLKIAVEALNNVAIYMTCDEVEIREINPDFCADQAALDTVNEAMDKIKELEK